MVLFSGDNHGEILEFVGYDKAEVPINEVDYVAIKTLEGTMWASPGDYIIKGVAGEFYPCKPGIFGETYEPV